MRPTGVADRRDFLKVTGVLSGWLAAGSPLALLAPSRAWALELTAFTSEQGAALLAALRTILPHDSLDDAVYAAVVHSCDGDAARDAATRELYSSGIASLGAAFSTANEKQRIATLKSIESTPFFQQLRVKAVSELYSSPLAFAHFGYQGEAFSKGGYLHRGFDDLRWLPEVPLVDSGPMPEAS